jgi:hypothetical protein
MKTGDFNDFGDFARPENAPPIGQKPDDIDSDVGTAKQDERHEDSGGNIDSASNGDVGDLGDIQTPQEQSSGNSSYGQRSELRTSGVTRDLAHQENQDSGFNIGSVSNGQVGDIGDLPSQTQSEGTPASEQKTADGRGQNGNSLSFQSTDDGNDGIPLAGGLGELGDVSANENSEAGDRRTQDSCTAGEGNANPARVSNTENEPLAPGQGEGASASTGDVGDLGNVQASQVESIDKPATTPQKAANRKPRIILPGKGRPDSEFATGMGRALSPHHAFYRRDDDVVQIRKREFDDKISFLGFDILKPVEAVTAVEEYVETGIMQPIEGTEKEEFVAKSMPQQTANKLIHATQFKRALPPIRRIVDIPLPVRWNGEIVHPSFGYDPRLHVYLNPDAPRISPLPLGEAKRVLNEILGGFYFRDQQSVTNSIAFLLTPYCRGLMGFRARFPLFIFGANRPRAGKDYLAGLNGIIYEGFSAEDPPLSNSDEEVRKKFVTALKHGRRSIHFGNCEGFIHSAVLKQAVTTTVIQDRFLGGHREARLLNELLISISGNSERLTYDEDIAARSRLICLEFAEENPNARAFQKTYLHAWTLENRVNILSAIAGLVHHWIQAGQPLPPSVFTSFPEWRNVVGGIVYAAGLGDPCAPDLRVELIGGDEETADMKVLFKLAHEEFQEKFVSKSDIYALLHSKKDLELFAYLGTISEHSTRVKLGRKLIAFKGRELGWIHLHVHIPNGRTERARYRFSRQPAITEQVNHVASLLGLEGNKDEQVGTDAGSPGEIQKAERPTGTDAGLKAAVEEDPQQPPA